MIRPGPPALLLLLLASVRAQEPRVEQLGWLAGCWERATGTTLIEEQWMRPRAGSMPGMSRTVRGERTVAWESLRIYEHEGRLVYAAHPSDQAPAEFRSVAVARDSVAFENAEHDFPQRIRYRAAGDSLLAEIGGMLNGEARRVEFRFARARCAEAGDGR